MGFFDRFRHTQAEGAHTARAWRSTYDRLIQRYSFLGGAHIQYTKATNAKFHPIDPLATLLREHWPVESADRVRTLLEQWQAEFEVKSHIFSIINALVTELNLTKGDLHGEAVAREIVDRMLQPEAYNGFFVRYVLGEVIDQDFGSEDKYAYWKAILTREIV